MALFQFASRNGYARVSKAGSRVVKGNVKAVRTMTLPSGAKIRVVRSDILQKSLERAQHSAHIS